MTPPSYPQACREPHSGAHTTTPRHIFYYFLAIVLKRLLQVVVELIQQFPQLGLCYQTAKKPFLNLNKRSKQSAHLLICSPRSCTESVPTLLGITNQEAFFGRAGLFTGLSAFAVLAKLCTALRLMR